jgi:hypothetical protein
VTFTPTVLRPFREQKIRMDVFWTYSQIFVAYMPIGEKRWQTDLTVMKHIWMCKIRSDRCQKGQEPVESFRVSLDAHCSLNVCLIVKA